MPLIRRPGSALTFKFRRLISARTEAQTRSPVFHVAHVKLQLVKTSQQPLLHKAEALRLVVDENKLHAPLEGRDLQPAVIGRTAYTQTEVSSCGRR